MTIDLHSAASVDCGNNTRAPASRKNVSEIDIRRTLAGDLYLALTEADNSQKLINLHIMIKPLINWIWIGSFVMVLGTVAVLLSSFKRKPMAAKTI